MPKSSGGDKTSKAEVLREKGTAKPSAPAVAPRPVPPERNPGRKEAWSGYAKGGMVKGSRDGGPKGAPFGKKK